MSLFTTQYLLKDPEREVVRTHCGKGENAGNQHFLLFPQCFQTYQRQKSSLDLLVLSHLQMLSVLSIGKE